MRAAVGRFLLRITNALTKRTFQYGTGLLLKGSIYLQTVGCIWSCCMGTSSKYNFCLKIFN